MSTFKSYTIGKFFEKKVRKSSYKIYQIIIFKNEIIKYNYYY